MEIHPNIKQLTLQQTIYDQSVEQAFELDYLLADYLPDIFKILKCEVTPAISSFEITEEKLTADLSIDIRVLYLAEETHQICSISQKQLQQKTIEIPQADSACIPNLSVKPDSCRCRVVNPRRLDIRGAVMLKINLEHPQTVSYFSKTEGNALQQRTASCSCVVGKVMVSQEISISEESSLPYGKPPIESILLHRCCPMIQEVKRSGDKVICKGSIAVHLLYLPQKEEASSDGEEAVSLPQTAELTVPVDAILNLTGPGADAKLFAQLSLINAELTGQAEEGSDKNEAVNGQYTLCIRVTAVENGSLSYVDDLYSTHYPVEQQTADYPLQSLQELISQVSICKNILALPNGSVSQVLDLLCSVGSVTLQQTGEALTLAVNLQLCLLACDENGMPFCMEKSIPCELNLDVAAKPGTAVLQPQIQVASCSYHLTDSNQLEVRTELSIGGCLYRILPLRMIVGMTADEQNPYPKDKTALRLYYAKQGEDIWEIAKHFCTDYDAVLSENEITGDLLAEDRMLLIPVL